MRSLINVQRFHGPLEAAGLVPKNCRVLDISIGVAGALFIRYEAFVTAEQLITLGGIFQTVGESIVAADAVANQRIPAGADDE